MQTLQKPKGFSLDRFLNDPVAMVGTVGAMGALVLTVWFVAGRNTPRDEESSGGGFALHGAASAKKEAAVAGSNLGVAKLKGRTSAGVLPESLKDAGGSASASADGTMTGTMAEIEAAQKAAAEKKDAEGATAKKRDIPVESVARGHVPGMAMDSTKLAAAGQGGFGAPGSLNNSDFSAAAGGGAAAAAAPAGSPPALDGSAAPAPDLGEGGPLLASASGGGRQAVSGSRQFLRGQTAGGKGPAAAGAAARRATGGITGGGTAGLPTGAGGPGFSDGSANFSRPGSRNSSSAEAAYSGGGAERMASAGGGAPAFAGGGVGSGRGALSSSGAGGAQSSSQKSTSMATKKELNDQSAKHRDTAQSYRGGVVVPLAQREKANAVFIEAKLAAASAILGSLDRQLAVEQGVFKASPLAKEALANSRAMISGGPDSLKARVDSSKLDMAAGAVSIMQIPDKCDFRPILKENVFHEWNPFNHPGYKGAMTVVDGKRGYYTEEETTLDLHGVATKGQDLLEGAARRMSNVNREAAAGIRLVDPEFDPAIESLRKPDPKGAARLASVAGRIKDDLARVSNLLPDQVADTASVGTQAQGKIQSATKEGYAGVQGLAKTVADRRLGYPDGSERDALDRNMANASRSSGEALSAVNSLSGTGADSMYVLTAASRASTYAMIDLCNSSDRLKDLAGKAK